MREAAFAVRQLLPRHAIDNKVAVVNNVSFLISTPFFEKTRCYKNVTYVLREYDNTKCEYFNMQIMEGRGELAFLDKQGLVNYDRTIRDCGIYL